MFEEDNTNNNTDAFNYDPSPAVKRKIQKLLDEEKAQRTRTWTHYQNLRVTDPQKYWDARSQMQMHQDAQALGEAFFDDEASNG